MKKVAVILAGCGFLDGAEIREAIITLLELDKHNADVSIFAPNANQHHVINHLTGEETTETRNILVEAARIARGKIKDLNELDPANFDALIMPGGYGVAKNLATFAFDGANGTVMPAIVKVVSGFIDNKKPVGAICISPTVIAKIMQGKHPILTLGPKNQLLTDLGAIEKVCTTAEISFDKNHGIVCTPAYMIDDKLSNIAEGISKLVTKIMEIS